MNNKILDKCSKNKKITSCALTCHQSSLVFFSRMNRSPSRMLTCRPSDPRQLQSYWASRTTVPLGTPHTVIPLDGAGGDAADCGCPAERLQDPDSMAPRSRSASCARAALMVATGGAGQVSAGQARQVPGQFHSLGKAKSDTDTRVYFQPRHKNQLYK